MTSHENLELLGSFLCRVINISEKDYKEGGKEIVEALSCITRKIITRVKACPGYAVGIQNLLSLSEHSLLKADSSCPHVAKLFEELEALKATFGKDFPCNVRTLPTRHSKDPLYCSVAQGTEVVTPAQTGKSKRKNKKEKTKEEEYLPLQVISRLKYWSAPLKKLDRKSVKNKIIKDQGTPSIKVGELSRRSRQVMTDFATVECVQDKGKKNELLARCISSAELIIAEYQVFMSKNPAYWHLISDQGCFPFRDDRPEKVELILGSLGNIHNMIIQYSDHLTHESEQKVGEIYAAAKRFIHGVPKWKWGVELNRIVADADSFIDRWANSNIRSLCHIYVCEQKYNRDTSRDTWKKVNAMCLIGASWYAAIYLGVLANMEPDKNDENYVHRYINWQSLITSLQRAMKCGPARDCYEIISSRVKNCKSLTLPDDHQVVQILQPFFDEKLSDLEWVKSLNELSVSPHLRNKHKGLSILMLYLPLVYKKHVERMQSPLVTYKDWKESEEVLHGISDFVMQGSLSCHWAHQIQCEDIKEDVFIKLLDMIFKSQFEEMIPPEKKEDIQPEQPPASLSIDEDLVTQTDSKKTQKRDNKKT